MSRSPLDSLLQEIRACRICANHLPHGCNPLLAASATARILIIGQAPGRKVHANCTPWDDPSGDILRRWLDVDRETFYDSNRIAMMPMGFCFPGSGPNGDLAPRPECAPQWHPRLLTKMPRLRLTLLIGRYAQSHYLGPRAGKSVTEAVRAWKVCLPQFLPLPHPSPRNRRWLKENPWFADEVLPELQRRVGESLA